MDQIQIRLNEALQNQDAFLKLCKAFIDIGVKHQRTLSEDKDWPVVYERVMTELIQNNAALVFKHSESPIEVLFLNSLALNFLNAGLPLVFLPPADDVVAAIDDLLKNLDFIQELAERFRKRTQVNLSLGEFIDHEFKQHSMTNENACSCMRDVIYYDWLALDKTPHVVLQGGFPDVRIDGKSVRVDLLAFLPAKPNKKIVIECDGFQFHGSQEAFTRDRKRDRALAAVSLQVLRFSGSEIYQDAPRTAKELFKQLTAWEDENQSLG